MLLSVEGVHRHFGGLVALNDVSLSVEEGQVFGLIGPNGSGKTTLVNIISGFLRPTSGVVKFDGVEIQPWKPYRIARLGMFRTFQITLNPHHITVMDTMLLCTHPQIGKTNVSAAYRP